MNWLRLFWKKSPPSAAREISPETPRIDDVKRLPDDRQSSDRLHVAPIAQLLTYASHP